MKVVVKKKKKKKANKGILEFAEVLEFKVVEVKLLGTIFKSTQSGNSTTKSITSTKQIKSKKCNF